jgi:tripartite-type tricarboxylate transporter receptor subunit TctC
MKIRVLMLIAGLVMALGTPRAFAQTAWPERPVKLVVPFAAGSGADAMARLLGERLGKAWGQPVVVENAAGAAGNIGVARAAKSAPDGYTLLMSGDAAIVVNVSMYATLPFDPVRDLVPISQMYLSPNVVVANNDLPVRDMPGLVALARAQPGRLAYASSGFGTSTHLGPELLRDMTGIDVVHVP